jgi:O-antigen/teichoic acid export membrane protein
MAGAQPLTLLLLGRQWAEMAPLLFWMSLLIFRLANLSALQSALMACGQSRVLFLTALVRFLVICVVMWLFAGQGIVVMTAAYVLTDTILMMQVLTWAASRHTPLQAKDIGRATAADTAAGVIFGLALTFGLAPRLAHLPVLPQILILGAGIGAVFLLRILARPSLRGELFRVLKRLKSKLRRGKGKNADDR